MTSSTLSLPEFQVLRLVDFAGAISGPADVIGVDVATSSPIVDRLIGAGLLHDGPVIRVSPEGRSVLDAWYASERDGREAERVQDLLDRFQPLDLELKSIATAWQDSDARDDWSGRMDAIASLQRLHARACGFLEEMAVDTPRFSEYTERLDCALGKIVDGRLQYVVGVTTDSYHTIWFQLHEDLLRTFGAARADQ
jgi:hypothetical protein